MISLAENELLNNIVLIKHASQLKDEAQYYLDDTFLATIFTPDKMQHDRNLYSSSKTISVLSDTSKIESIINILPLGMNIIKVNGSFSDSSFTQLQSFKSLTTTSLIPIDGKYFVHHENDITSNCYQYLFGLISYSICDIQEMINKYSAYVLSIKDHDKPVASCVVYNLYSNIWEIGALSTDENYRRQHIAEYLVSYATNHLLSLSLIPRYHVNMSNIASYNLALKCGYFPFISFNHYSFIK